MEVKTLEYVIAVHHVIQTFKKMNTIRIIVIYAIKCMSITEIKNFQ